MINGDDWVDNRQQLIQAHGGCLLAYQGWYYWYGEDRQDNYYVSCYRTKDFQHWEFRRHILTTASIFQPTRVKACQQRLKIDNHKVNIERPKVLYNQVTHRFVLWAHYENGLDYTAAAIMVASCSTPDGDFVFHGAFRPFGYMSRDCTLFEDEDEQAYLISAARDNADMHIYQLSADYLNVVQVTNRLWSNEFREAPAIFKQGSMYYMLTSGTSGWRPNQGKYSCAKSLAGTWTDLKEFGDKTTYQSQPAFVFQHHNQLIYVGDRWGGATDYQASRYVWLPLIISGQQVTLTNQRQWSYQAQRFVFQ